MNKLTTEQAYQNIEQVITQSLGAGLFKDFNTVAIAQQSLLTIKTFIDEKSIQQQQEKKKD